MGASLFSEAIAEGPKRKPVSRIARVETPSGVTASIGGPAHSPPAGASFAGPADLNNNPDHPAPDAQGAVGPNHLVSATNSQVLIQSRAGSTIMTMTLADFWTPAEPGPVPGNKPFNPRVIFNPLADRFIIAACATSPLPGSTRERGELLLAVSTTNDATGPWIKHRILLDDGAGELFASGTRIGFNKKWVAVSVDVPSDDQLFGPSTLLYVFDQAALFAGDALSFDNLSGNAAVHELFFSRGVTPAATYDDRVEELFLLASSSFPDSSYLELHQITGLQQLEFLNIVFSDQPWAGLPESAGDGFAPQSGTSVKVATGDDSPGNVVYRNGSLWTAQTVYLPADDPTRCTVQWWEISPVGDVRQIGRVDPSPSSPFFYAYPSIAVNAVGDVLLGYTRFAATEFASAHYSFRTAADEPGMLQPDTLLSGGDGLGKYEKRANGAATGPIPWGAWTGAAPDPMSDDLWMLLPYAAGTASVDVWATQWGRLQLGPEIPRASIAAGENDANVVTEGDAGTRTAQFKVTLNSAPTAPVSVQYQAVSDSAVSPGDFDAVSGTLSFAAGETSKTISVPVRGDFIPEPDESFRVVLSDPSGLLISARSARGIVRNDDTFTGQALAPFANATQISVDADDPFADFAGIVAGAPYPSTITVAGQNSALVVTKAVVRLKGLAHTWPNDLEIVLMGPNGKSIRLMSDAGGTTPVGFTADFPPATNPATAVTLTFDDLAPALVPVEGLTSGAYRPTDYEGFEREEDLPAPAPKVADTGLSVFSGISPNGEWKLFVADNYPGVDFGFLLNGWELELTVDSIATAIPVLSIADAELVEPDSGTATMAFDVTLSRMVSEAVTVNYSLSDGTARRDRDDYQGMGGTITFSPGQLTQRIFVPIVGDTRGERDEDFFVTLSASVNAAIADGRARGVIKNGADVLPRVSISSVALVEGDTGVKSAVFSATLSPASTEAVKVPFKTVNGTARGGYYFDDTFFGGGRALFGGDFEGVGGTDFESREVVFRPGERSKDIVIHIGGDTVLETNETFSVVLLEADNAAIGNATGTGTIINDDLAPTISVASASGREGNDAGNPNVVIHDVTLSAESETPVTVQYSLVPLSALADADYTPVSGTLTFAAADPSTSTPGETLAQLVVPLIPDTTEEGAEAYLVVLSNPINGTLGEGNAVGTIQDDDGAAGVFFSNSTPIMIPESGAATPYPSNVTVTGLSGAIESVGVTIRNFAHTFPSDVQMLLVGPSGEAVVLMAGAGGSDDVSALTFSIRPDAAGPVPSPLQAGTFLPTDQGFGLDFATPAPASPYSSQLETFRGQSPNGTWSLYVEDTASGDSGSIASGWSLEVKTSTVPLVSISDVEVNEAPGATAEFDVTLSVSPSSSVTVPFSTRSGTALEGPDYVATSGAVTFLPGETAKTISILIVNDNADESPERFFVTLGTPTNARLESAFAAASILDTDVPPNTSTFASTTSIAIPATGTEGPASPYPSTIEVGGLTGVVTRVSVTLDGLSHTFPSDIDVLLVGPGASAPSVLLLSGAGGSAAASSASLTFDSRLAAGFVPEDQLVSGTYLPTSGFGAAIFETATTPPPAPPYGDSLRVFDGTSPNGVWKLYVRDHAGGDSGMLQGWTLRLTVSDALPVVSIADAPPVAEGTAGAGGAAFQVTLSSTSPGVVLVDYATREMSGSDAAAEGVDYVEQRGTLAFPPGTASQTLSVPLIADADIESDETFEVILSAPMGAALGGSFVATGTIQNDDAVAPPANDHFLDAQVLNAPLDTAAGSNRNSTGEPGEPDLPFGIFSTLNTVWYRWTALGNGPVTVDTFGSSFDTVLAAYRGDDLSTLRRLDFNDDTNGLQSRVTFRAQTGQTYYFQVDGFGGSTGDIVIHVEGYGGLDGQYFGLLDAGTVEGEAAGLLQLSLRHSGTFTLTGIYRNFRFSVVGEFDANGVFVRRQLFNPDIGGFTLELRLASVQSASGDVAGQVTGRIYLGSATEPGPDDQLATFALDQSQPDELAPTGTYTFSIPVPQSVFDAGATTAPAEGASEITLEQALRSIPIGSGVGVATVRRNSRGTAVRFTGRLGDSTPFAFGGFNSRRVATGRGGSVTRSSRFNAVSFFSRLYRRDGAGGRVYGNLLFRLLTGVATAPPEVGAAAPPESQEMRELIAAAAGMDENSTLGNLRWVHPERPGAVESKPFNVHLRAVGGRYNKPRRNESVLPGVQRLILAMTHGRKFDDGSVERAPINARVVIDPGNRFRVESVTGNAFNMSLRFSPATGMLRGRFDPQPGAPRRDRGDFIAVLNQIRNRNALSLRVGFSPLDVLRVVRGGPASQEPVADGQFTAGGLTRTGALTLTPE